MRPFLTKARLHFAIRRGDVVLVQNLLPKFLAHPQTTKEDQDDLMFEAASHALQMPRQTAAALFMTLLEHGLDPNARRTTDQGLSYTPLSLTVALQANFYALPPGLHQEVCWLYAADRQLWSSGSESARLIYYPEVLAALLDAGADSFSSPVVNQWYWGDLGLSLYSFDLESVGTLLQQVQSVNNNPPLLPARLLTEDEQSGRQSKKRLPNVPGTIGEWADEWSRGNLFQSGTVSHIKRHYR